MSPVVGTLDMTVVGSRLFVVGADPGEDFRQDGVIFVSDDGVNWVRLAEGDRALTLGAVLMYAVTEGGPGLVAVGMSCEDNAFPCESGLHATAWASVDGASWTRTSHDPAVFGDPATETSGMMDVTATTTGSLVAVGWLDDWTLDDSGVEDSVLTRPATWTSPDGIVWQRAWLGEGFELTTDVWNNVPTQPMHATVQGPDGGLVAVGAMLDQDGESTAAVWTSTDGSTWDRIDPTSPVFGQKTTMTDVTWGSDGYVAVGTEDEITPAIWTSPDGHSWTRVDISNQPFDYISSLGSVAALDAGYVTVGPQGFIDAPGGVVTVWTSPDGATWDRVHSITEGYTSGVVVVDGGIAVSGGMPYDNDYHAAVWVGPRSDPDAPPPEPPPTPEPAPTGIAAVEEGVSCEQLATEEYTYAEAVSYWMRYDMPADLDPDANGLPCEAFYLTTDVAAVFGGPGALPVRLVSDLPAQLFEASGAAVDAGVICPSGTTEFTDDSTPPKQEGASGRWEDVYTCDDGSGTFTIGADVFIDVDRLQHGVWDIGSGTGRYETLTGGGGVFTAPTGPDTWSDDLIGRVTSETNEN